MLKDNRNATANPEVLNRLWTAIDDDRDADPKISEFARVLDGGTARVAQRFGEEALECLLEATSGNHDAVVGKSADVLYHMLMLWVKAGVRPHEIWLEMEKREKASDPTSGPNGSINRMFKSVRFNTAKIT